MMDLAAGFDKRVKEFMNTPATTVAENGMRVLAHMVFDADLRNTLKTALFQSLLPTLMVNMRNGTPMGKAAIAFLEATQEDSDPMFKGMETEEQQMLQIAAQSLLQQVGG